MVEEKKSIFRQETLDRISSPEQLSDYLRVTTPGLWVIFAAMMPRAGQAFPERNLEGNPYWDNSPSRIIRIIIDLTEAKRPYLQLKGKPT